MSKGDSDGDSNGDGKGNVDGKGDSNNDGIVNVLSRLLALRNTVVGKSTRVGAEYENVMVN
jgi:hypothetical protein